MNRNYKNGREKEYRERKKLLAEGWEIVVRSAGSHSPFDLIAIRHLELKGKDLDPRDVLRPRKLVKNEILLIQCKVGKDSPYERNKAWEEIKGYAGEYTVACEVR